MWSIINPIFTRIINTLSALIVVTGTYNGRFLDKATYYEHKYFREYRE